MPSGSDSYIDNNETTLHAALQHEAGHGRQFESGGTGITATYAASF